MVINTFDRDANLKNILTHYMECGNIIQDIHVTWNEPTRNIPDWLKQLEKTSGVVLVDRNNGTNLTNRFRPRKFASDAIFSQDDDLYYSCDILRAAHNIWVANQEALVGFAPRWMRNGAEDSETHDWKHAWDTHSSNIVMVTKGGFLHKKWYNVFFDPAWQAQRDMIDDNLTGEDIMMGMLVSSRTKRPPIPLLVRKNHVVTLPEGIRTLTTHGNIAEKFRIRGRVANTLNKVFEYPLIETKNLLDPLAENANAHVDASSSQYVRFERTY